MANNQLLASDNFVSGSLAAGWTKLPSAVDVVQVVAGSPNVTEPKTAANGANYGQYWSGLVWPNDQISEFTISNLAAVNNTFDSLIVRASASDKTRYQMDMAFAASAYTLTVSSVDASGSATVLGSVAGLTPVNGDVFSFAAIGISISVYLNYNRIFYKADTTIKSGSPGYLQLANATSAVTNSKISSWRGYSAVQKDGIWTKQQIIATPLITDGTGSKGLELHSKIIFEGNAQVLSGTVYKMWPDGNGNTYYAESTDLKNWTFLGGVTPTAVITGRNQTAVIKVGSTYYAYCQSTPGTTPVQCYTSTDGVNFSLQNANCITLGAGGHWDSFAVYPFYAITYVGGTFYGLYGGCNSGSYNFGTGLATSTDGINWTKYLTTGGPVIAVGNGNACGITQVGSTYYTWCQTAQVGQGNASAPDFDPAESTRFKSTDLINWTRDVKSIHHSGMHESVNANTGYGTTIGYLFDLGGVTYNVLTSGQGDAVAPVVPQIMLATVPTTVANVVAFPEDAIQQVATDVFTGGAGGLGANWTTPAGGTNLQVVSGPFVEPTATSTVCSAVYTGASFGADHYSEVTLHTLSGTLGQSIVSPSVRMSTAAVTAYESQILSPSGTSDLAAKIIKRVAGASAPIGPTITIQPSVGDVFRLAVITGSDGFPTLSLYQNEFLILQVQDSSTTPLTTGGPGITASSTVSLASAQISGWAGGNANVLPNYPPTNVGTGYSVPDCRVSPSGPNASRVLNGTLIYDVQTSDNAAVPGVDSRVSPNIPVDSRVSPNIPINSRTPGTFGPGVN